MTSIISAPYVETRLETQTVLYPALRQLVRLLPCDYKRVVSYLQEEAKHNLFVVENPDLSERGSREALLGDVLPDWYTPVAQEPSLQDHLYGQISALSLPAKQREALVYLTQWLSPSGYLDEAAQTWADGSPWSLSELEAVVPLLQSLEPSGIGARSLRECLLLQLKDQPQSLAFLLVKDYLEELAHFTGNSLEAKQSREALLQKLQEQSDLLKQNSRTIPLNVDLDTVSIAIRQIQELEPRPARNFGHSNAPIVIPDLKALQTAGVWQVSLVCEVEQRFCLNQEAISLLTSDKTQDKQRLEALLKKAQSLLIALKQWQENILKVGQFLVERQQTFLSSRERLDLVPTPQYLVAQAVGLSDATVSRIVRGRYILIGDLSSRTMPLGALCVPVRVGGRTSQQIQQLLMQLIQEESATNPYSDAQLAQLLKLRFGLPIARRTVAKYRNLAGLEPAHSRHHCY